MNTSESLNRFHIEIKSRFAICSDGVNTLEYKTGLNNKIYPLFAAEIAAEKLIESQNIDANKCHLVKESNSTWTLIISQ